MTRLHQLREIAPRVSQGLTPDETEHAIRVVDLFENVLEYLGWRLSGETDCDPPHMMPPGIMDHPLVFRRYRGETLVLLQPYVDRFLRGAEAALAWSDENPAASVLWSFDASFHKSAGASHPVVGENCARTVSVVVGKQPDVMDWAVYFARAAGRYQELTPRLTFHPLWQWRLANDWVLDPKVGRPLDPKSGGAA